MIETRSTEFLLDLSKYLTESQFASNVEVPARHTVADAHEIDKGGRGRFTLGKMIGWVDARAGKMAFLDNDAYEQGVVKWERMKKFRILVIIDDSEKEFQ